MSKNKKLKKQNKELFLSKNKYSEKYYSFDFSFLTDDPKYSFYNIQGNGNITTKVVRSFFEKLKRLSEMPISMISQQNKRHGFEMLQRSRFKKKSIFKEIDKKITPTEDMSYHIFRFGSEKYRIICKQCEQDGRDTTLYVIAIDWDLSTYDHD